MSATRIETLARKHQLNGYINGAVNANLVGDAFYLAPMVRTGSLVNTVWSYDQARPFRIPDTKRALGGKAIQVDFGGTSEDITLETHAMDTGIDVQAQTDEEIVMNLQTQVNLAASLASLAHFNSVITAIEAASGLNTATLDISNADAGTGVADALNGYIKTILLACGSFSPNVQLRFLWGWNAAQKVLNATSVVNRVNGGATTGQVAVPTLNTIGNLLLTPGTQHRMCTAISDSGELNAAYSVANRSFINDDEILIVAASPNPTRQDPSAFKTLWKGSEGMGSGYYKSEDGRVEYAKFDWAYKVYTANAKAAYKVTVQA